MSDSRIHSTDKRQAAVDDFLTTGDTIAAVAARHGVARSTLGTWVSGLRSELAYMGGYELRGGVWHPLFPERRSA
jgi:transposase-like protein